MEAAAAALGSGEPGVDDAYAVAFDRWMASGAADLEDRIAPVLADLGLDVGPDALMTALSGGQAARVALAALLLSRFDVVLLDEPTNDLDLDGLGAARGVRPGAARRRRAGLARPRVPGPLRDPRSWSSTSRRARSRSTTAATTPSSRSERSHGATRARPTSSTPAPGRTSCSGRARSASGAPGRAQRDEEEPRQRQDPAQGRHRVLGEAGAEGPPDGVADRAARRGRGAPQGVGAAVRHRRRAALERRWSPPSTRRSSAG